MNGGAGRWEIYTDSCTCKAVDKRSQNRGPGSSASRPITIATCLLRAPPLGYRPLLRSMTVYCEAILEGYVGMEPGIYRQAYTVLDKSKAIHSLVHSCRI